MGGGRAGGLPGVATHAYRDSGRPGDGVCAELAAAAPALLTLGGTMQYLANWVHIAGEDWRDRVAGWFDRQDWLAATDLPALLGTRFRVVPGVVLKQEASLADGGWSVDRQRLEMTTGLHWIEEIDPLIVALAGGCDGQVPLREQIALLAAAHDAPAELLGPALAGMVRHLVERGILVP